ncbi:MAG TPA: hypothetical protein VI172_16000 [Candidatus Dormibacteraeota bacterium]|jgi:hypothetical protein
MTEHDKRTALALRERADAFRQFARNGRWGTCVDCPMDRRGDAYPEFCEHTTRCDHRLTADGLAENYMHFYRTANVDR